MVQKRMRNFENGDCHQVGEIDFSLFERGREIVDALQVAGCDSKAGYRGKDSILLIKRPETKVAFDDGLDFFLWGAFNFFRVFRISHEDNCYFGIGFEDASVHYEQYEIVPFEDIYNARVSTDSARIISYNGGLSKREYRISENDYNTLIGELRKIGG